MMPLNQRLVLETLKRRRHATLRAVVEDLAISRDILKNVFVTLEAQGYLERVGKGHHVHGGHPPVMYRWTGKAFPSSADFEQRRIARAAPASPHVAALIAGIYAMCSRGGVAA
ncbi:hypothetical protein [Caballeronia sp. INML2]|uniref:hypothetical protein n=1 Tax=Caballeronia sp. INML2 TaxID=2921748 RepID=UPI002028800D|nr:hypothetical protein [Caballeronia sp. INML2]